MQKTHVAAEMLDGTTHGPVRLLFADKLRYENSAKANGWTFKDEMRLQSFLTWAALERNKLIDMKYIEFLEQVADVSFNVEDDEEDPQTAGHDAP